MPSSPRRVLIVDDEVALLESLTSAVRALGHLADTAPDGRRALDLTREVAYDVIVTDLQMPVLGGSSLISTLLESGISPPVVVITGFANLDVAIDCLRAGAVDFLVKPFEIEAFLNSVQKALGKRRTTAGVSEEVWGNLRAEHDLTRRQAEIVRAFCETGLQNRPLAEQLSVSQETVKSHLKAAFQKLGVSNRAELLKKLRDLGARV